MITENQRPPMPADITINGANSPDPRHPIATFLPTTHDGTSTLMDALQTTPFCYWQSLSPRIVEHNECYFLELPRLGDC